MNLRHAVMVGLMGRHADRFHEYHPARSLAERLDAVRRVPSAQGIEVVYPSEFRNLEEGAQQVRASGWPVSAAFSPGTRRASVLACWEGSHCGSALLPLPGRARRPFWEGSVSRRKEGPARPPVHPWSPGSPVPPHAVHTTTRQDRRHDRSSGTRCSAYDGLGSCSL